METPQRLLVLEPAASSLAADPVRVEQWAGTVFCDRKDWASFVPDSLLGCRADLVVPVAVNETHRAKALFEWLRTHPIPMATLAVLPQQPEPGFLQTAIEAVDDFVLWPASPEELSLRVKRLLPSRRSDAQAIRERMVGDMGLALLVGRDPAFLATVAKIPEIARSGVSVLITGETGTGKELCARAIHHLSSRRNHPFIPVDCGALPDYLFENELFGHARGAYTDAHTDQKGLVAMAEGGTIFLDEVDTLSHAAQAKLLRFLQERTYKPLGADRFLRADVQIVSASNRDLEPLVGEKQFRSDLFFRLNVVSLHLTPLRQRRGDIPLLVQHFVKSLSAEKGVHRKGLTLSSVRMLSLYHWPGNVRELYNVIQRALLLHDGSQILPSDVLMSSEPSSEPDRATFREARARAIDSFEKVYVEQLLRRHEGNVTRAAREAKQDRRAFGRLIKKHSISRLQP